MTALRRVLLAPVLVAAGLVTLGPAAPAQAWQDVADFIWITDQYPSEDLQGYGDVGRFRFHDSDLDPALSGLSVVASSTTDPTGIRVLTERTARADPYYWGTVAFSSGPSDQVAGQLQVSDGDTVTITYAEPRDRNGRPQVRTAEETWRASTRPPDFREVGLADPADGSAVVRGAQRAAPAGSTVRVYTPGSAAPAVTGTADGAGRFLLSSAAELPPMVEVTAQEHGLPESPRLEVARARVAGRVVLPGTEERGVRSAMVSAQGTETPGCPSDCPWGGAYSDRDGYFYLAPPHAPHLPPGDYVLAAEFQGFMDGERAEWHAPAYADPLPAAVTLPDDPATVVAADLRLMAPLFFGEVLDTAGVPVVEAQIDIFNPAGGLVTNTYTEEDGRFALHRADGDYRLRVIGPVGCVRYTEAWIDLSVRGGLATPSTATVRIDPVGIHDEVWTIPLDPPKIGVTVRLDDPGVEITLTQPEGSGTVSIRCTSEHWDDMEVLEPPLDLHWDADFGEATVCLDYDPAHVAAAGAAEGDLELLHRESNGSVSSIATRHDPVADTVCGETTSFSPFALGVPGGGEPSPAPEPTPEPAPGAGDARARATDDSCPDGRVPEDGFADVMAGTPHEASIDCVVWWGVARGRTSTAYAPGESVTRAQMATFLANLLDRSGDRLPDTPRDWFTDDDGSPHEASINRLAEAGVVRGRADGGYGPGLPVTRDAMATFLVRAFERRSGQALPASRDWFADDDGNTHEPAIDRAATAGFTGGTADGGYAPALAVKREQMASFLARVLDLLVEQQHAAAPD